MMPDISEILNTLDDEDKRLYTQHRTEMRRSYMTAHNSVLGIHTWDSKDDMFLDLIDLKLALLFDKSGRSIADKPIDATKTEVERIENDIKETLKSVIPEASEATKSMIGEWGKSTPDWKVQPK